MNAKSLYLKLHVDRAPVLERARRLATLTIPALLPPDGHNDSSKLPSPAQSVGARGVNNLQSKLLLALFPPGTPFYRLSVDEDVAEEAGSGIGEIQKRLSKIESKAMARFEASVVRPRMSEVLAHLIVAGNSLTFFNSLEDFRVFRLDQYVVQRDATGAPVRAAVLEAMHPSGLPEEVREACEIKAEDKEVEAYTVVEWVDGRVKWRTEINDKIVPKSEGDVPADLSPWQALRWKAVPGQDYGRSMAEEYEGDLTSLEALSQSVVEFAAVASKILFLVHPNSTTDVRDLNEAETGEFVSGNKQDIDVLSLEKFADFQVANAVLMRIEERLSYAFLLRAGVTRDAERVTAEEIRAVAQELEDVLGGVYTILAQELQLPFVRRKLHVLQRKAVIPVLPKRAVRPVIVTGFQALGRNHSLNRLRGFIADLNALFGPQGTVAILNQSEIATRLGVGWGVEGLDSLVKSQDQIAQETAQNQQNALAADMASKAAGPAAAAAMRQQ